MKLNPWLGIALYLALISALFASLRAYQQKRAPHPEWVRKLAHVGTGLITLGLPWLFPSAWPVLLLAVLSISAIIARKSFSSVGQHLSQVLDGVARSSGGELYFPLSVAVVFVLSRGDPLLFSIPVLILTFADAAAALAGVRYGQLRYHAGEGEKSAEGSIAFFTVAFLSTHIPVLLFTQVGRAESLLIGLMLGLVAMLLEAIAWRGLDNLFIPLGGFILLKIYLEMDLRALVACFSVTFLLVIFVLVFRRHTTLNTGALLGAAFVGYLFWAVGGWTWLVPPVVLFVTYTMLSPRTEWNIMRVHNVHAMFSVTSAGLLWAFMGKALHNPQFYYPYSLGFAAHLSMIGIARLRKDFPAMPVPALMASCVLKGWLIVFLPYYLIEGMTMVAALRALAGAGITALAALLFYYVQPGMEDCPIDRARWLRQASVGALTSALGLIPIYMV